MSEQEMLVVSTKDRDRRKAEEVQVWRPRLRPPSGHDAQPKDRLSNARRHQLLSCSMIPQSPLSLGRGDTYYQRYHTKDETSETDGTPGTNHFLGEAVA